MTYKLTGENMWDKSSSKNATNVLMDREKRITALEKIEIRNKKPETSTPSP